MNTIEIKEQGNTTGDDSDSNLMTLEERVVNTMNNMMCSLIWLRIVMRKHHRTNYIGRSLRVNKLIKLA